MERRDFLKQTAPAMALAAVSGTTGLAFHNRDTTRRRTVVTKTADFEVSADPNLPALTLARNTDPTLALNAALDGIGGIARFVRPGETVTVKPNVGWDRAPAQGANTHPALVGEMVRLCLAAGAAQVIVTDVSCNDPRRSFLRSGIREAAEGAGARVILPAKEDFLETELGGEVLTRWPVLKYFIETDRFINMPIVKQHSLTRSTVGMKNLYGILGGRRNRLHQEIDQSIVDLAAFVRPTLTVVDATRVLLRGGPQGGSLDDVSIENTVMCATDLVAADSRAVEFLGVSGNQIGHVALAGESGLGSLDYRAAGYKEIV
jgi:uncharacterized protein (DUF362 family)